MRNKYLMIATSFFLLSVTGFQVLENPEFLLRLKKTVRDYHASYPEEKIYLHLDKPFYKPGDDIWFNAFVLNSNTHQPTGISDVVHVELVDPKGNVTSRLELVIKEGTAQGDFALQKTAPGGIYQIRAYTQWMKNFGKETLFEKEIQVQRIVTPRLLLKLEYEKEAYGPGEHVRSKLTITNLKNERVANASIKFTVQIKGTELFRSEIFSDPQGMAAITFQLPDSLDTTDGLLQAIISTQGVEESITRSIPIVLNKIAVQFFPEGGHCIENVRSRIAFKALNEFGKGADVSGAVVDENNIVITRFESFHMGMGAFEMTPLRGVKYFARIESPAGNESLIPLPGALAAGYTITLKEVSSGSTAWSIHSPAARPVFLVGQTHGEIYYANRITLTEGENSVKISSENFPAGITVFTLFDEEGIGQCERLVFLNSEKGLNIRLKPDKKHYRPREKINLKIETTDNNGKPVPAKLSLSVVDDQLIAFADDKQDNILSSMLLSSEVKGEIQEPSFYVDPAEAKASRALDYLMMTQGWRRFTWKEIKETKVITYVPEKVKNVAGRLVNSKREGVSSEVTLLEIGNKRRTESIQTTPEGHFLFKNIDPTVPVLLLTRKPAEITIQKEPTYSISLNDQEGTVLLPEAPGAMAAALNSAVNRKAEEVSIESGLDMSLGADVSQLSEVVIVTGYGVENKRSIAGSIVTIVENSTEGMISSVAIENLMQGRVAGLSVQPQSGNPGAQSTLSIRGISSLAAGRTEPLYVINGHPIGTSVNQNFSSGSMFGPEDIQSIEVLHSPEATALFGSAAANGAILITTRSWLGFPYFKSTKRPAKYSSFMITPRKFSATREFYVPPPPTGKTEKREDFRSTVYWNHTVVTDARGEAKLSFYNNDAASAFRITAEGVAASGLIGRKEEVYYTQLPFSLDARLPEYLGFEDVLKLPVQVKNETSSALSGRITLTIPSELSVEEPTTTTVQVQPQSTQTFWFTISPKGIEGEYPVVITLESSDYQDEISHTIHVKPAGFPVRMSFSAKELDKTIQFSIRDAERNSVKAELTAFPDVLSDLFTGAESILEEPHGCFEQVSSSTFPNILALQFLKQSGLIQPDVEKRALGYIQNGYQKLAAYEIKGGGFEWFGHPPAHEGLSAYGLIQFHEMKKVFPKVDDVMMSRTRDWLLSRRNGRGGFKQNAGKYGFSAASEEVNNAYILYALSETGTKDLSKEYDQALAEVRKSKDMYRMALMAITAFNIGKAEDYTALVNSFKETIRLTGFNNLKIDHSIVRSYGTSLVSETVALWTLALMKPSGADHILVRECIQHILKSRSYGQFGSTQGTTLALKTLTEYARLVRTTREDGEIHIFVDNKIADKLAYGKDVREKLVLNNFSGKLSANGEQTVRILFAETNAPLPYTANVQWYTKHPPSSSECKVSLNTSLNAASIRMNETVRLTAVLKNKSPEGLPMAVAVIGIPAGLSAQPWQLKELQEKQVFDFYEITGGNLVLYYREMAPNGIQTINLDLKAEIPGTYTGAASSAYLYYTNEYKDWAKGNSILIN
jgi:TonB-dependent SusC/RagA subfamily outer membrane receptor